MHTCTEENVLCCFLGLSFFPDSRISSHALTRLLFPLWEKSTWEGAANKPCLKMGGTRQCWQYPCPSLPIIASSWVLPHEMQKRGGTSRLLPSAMFPLLEEVPPWVPRELPGGSGGGGASYSCWVMTSVKQISFVIEKLPPWGGHWSKVIYSSHVCNPELGRLSCQI